MFEEGRRPMYATRASRSLVAAAAFLLAPMCAARTQGTTGTAFTYHGRL